MARKAKFQTDDIKRAYTKANGNLSAAAKLAGMSYGGYSKRARSLGLVAAPRSQKEPEPPQVKQETDADREEREAHEANERYNQRRRAESALSLLTVCGGNREKAVKAIDAILTA